MTPVTSGTVAGARRAEVLVCIVLFGALISSGALVIRIDRRSPRHAVLRDPISWFTSREAPEPALLRFALAMVGIALIALAVVGLFSRRRRLAVGVVGMAGGLVLGTALVPLDCSVRLDYCEKLVAAGFADDDHLIHVGLSAALIILAVIATVSVAWQHRSGDALLLAIVVAGSALVIFAVPTWEFLGAVQMVALVGGAIASVRLWHGGLQDYLPPA